MSRFKRVEAVRMIGEVVSMIRIADSAGDLNYLTVELTASAVKGHAEQLPEALKERVLREVMEIENQSHWDQSIRQSKIDSFSAMVGSLMADATISGVLA